MARQRPRSDDAALGMPGAAHRTLEDRVGQLLDVAADDPGCEAVFDVLHVYVDALLSGKPAAEPFASVLSHLRQCLACREDAEGLLRAIEEIEREARRDG